MFLNIRAGITFMVTAFAYYLLERIFGLGENLITGQVTINVIPINVLDVIFITIALAGIAIFSYSIILRNRPRKEATIDVFSSTDTFRLDRFLKITKERIDIAGITLEQINQYDTIFGQALRDGKHARLLLLNPDSHLREDIERLVNTTDTDDEIRRTLRTINRLNLRTEASERLEIRLYDLIPTNALILVDRHKKSGFIQTEPYLYGIPRAQRRMFRIYKRNKQQRPLFELYQQSFDNIWELSTPVSL